MSLLCRNSISYTKLEELAFIWNIYIAIAIAGWEKAKLNPEERWLKWPVVAWKTVCECYSVSKEYLRVLFCEQRIFASVILWTKNICECYSVNKEYLRPFSQTLLHSDRGEGGVRLYFNFLAFYGICLSSLAAVFNILLFYLYWTYSSWSDTLLVVHGQVQYL